MRELLKLQESKLLFFDIETAPIVKELTPDSPLYNSWEYKVNKTGEKTQKEILDSYKKEAGLYPEFSKVVCVVIGKIIKNKIVLITYNQPDERELLNKLNNKLNERSGDTLIGFVNIGFDTPFIFKRMIINGIKPSDSVDSSGLKPWEVEEVDLAKIWQGTSFNRASLINISTAFELPSPKDDISGIDVGRVYWNEKDGLDRISEYCRKDVETTINVFRKMCLKSVLTLAKDPTPLEKIPMLNHLFNGGEYTPEYKNKLEKYIKDSDEITKDRVITILKSIVSKAKGKETKITREDIKYLKSL